MVRRTTKKTKKEVAKPTLWLAFLASVYDATKVTAYVGISATSVLALFQALNIHTSHQTQLASALTVVVNVGIFLIKRTFEYLSGKRPLPEFLANLK